MSIALIANSLIALANPIGAAPGTVEARPTSAERVSFADLDLQGQAGIATLQARLHAAAGRVCDTYGVQSLAAKLDEMRCKRSALAAASGAVDRLAARSEKVVEMASTTPLKSTPLSWLAWPPTCPVPTASSRRDFLTAQLRQSVDWPAPVSMSVVVSA